MGWAMQGFAPTKNDHIRLFEIVVRIRRRIEPKGLFVRDGRARHALTGVAITVQHAHTEFR